MQYLTPQPLTSEAFAPFGEVIGIPHEMESQDQAADMNDARFARYQALATSDNDRDTVISIAQCLAPSTLPYTINMVERHPYGSQAFIPLSATALIVVVARAGEPPAAEALHAFLAEPGVGINYHRGTWHMPLIAFEAGHRFLIVDSNDERDNCDEHTLSPGVLLSLE